MQCWLLWVIYVRPKRVYYSRDAIISQYPYIRGLSKTTKRATNKAISDKNHGNSNRNANTLKGENQVVISKCIMREPPCIFQTSRMWYLLSAWLFTGICKLCRRNHLAAVGVANPVEDSFTVQCDEPATAQSDEPAAAQSEEPATTQSQEPAVTQCEELTTELAPEPIPEFLPSQPHASSDSESQLEVCFVLLFCR